MIHGERFTFKPTPNFEFGFSRTGIFAGEDVPFTLHALKTAFSVGEAGREPRIRAIDDRDWTGLIGYPSCATGPRSMAMPLPTTRFPPLHTSIAPPFAPVFFSRICH